MDIQGIGMYTLGKYRKSITEEEKSKYQKLFKSYFLKSFSSRLVDYTDPKINVVSKKLAIITQLLIVFSKLIKEGQKLK